MERHLRYQARLCSNAQTGSWPYRQCIVIRGDDAGTQFHHILREEAELYGIKVSAVLPGMVKSDLWDNAVNVKDYNYKTNMEKTGLKPITAAQVAHEILQGIAANDRSIIFPRLNKVILRLYQLMPATMTKLAVKALAKSKS